MNWIDEAAKVVRKDRQSEYGAPLLNFLRTALLWSTYLNRVVNPLDVAWMMVQVKVAREMNMHKDDNAIDSLGYILCWQSMDEDMRAHGYSEGALALTKMTLDEMHKLAALLTEEAKYARQLQE